MSFWFVIRVIRGMSSSPPRPHRSAKRGSESFFREQRGDADGGKFKRTGDFKQGAEKKNNNTLLGGMPSQQACGLSATEHVHFPITDFFLWFGCTGKS